jgi:hypothetical protein
MRRVAAGIGLICCFSYAAEQAAGGEIVFDSPRFVERAPAGASELDISFKFRNGSDEPVAVDTLDSGCGCLKGTAMFSSVAPGATGEIRGKFLTENQRGKVVKSLWVTFSNGERHELVTEVTIPRGLVIEPSSLEWAQGEVADERRVELVVESGEPLELTELSSSLPQFELRREVLEAGRKYALWVRPKSTSEPLAGVIEVRTSSSDSRDAIRAVFASVVPAKVEGGDQ